MKTTQTTLTRRDAELEVARLTAARNALKARREAAYASGAVAVALAYEDEIAAMVEQSDRICEAAGLPVAW